MTVGPRTNALTVRTPEGIHFSIPLAGPVTRFLAWIIDMFAISVVTRLLAYVVSILGVLSEDLATALVILVYFLVSIGYGIILEYYWRGQTLGKRVLSIRVMDEQGLKLAFSQVAVRNLLRPVDSLPLLYMVGGLTAVISRRGQRLGDLAANTVVVWQPNIPQPDLDQLLTDKYNSFHNYPHLEARLRQETRPQEAALALRALLRRDYLDADARIELFKDVADHFKNIVTFPPEAAEGISDEQYVRNVVGALYRPERGRAEG